MILTCPDCATRYFVAENAVPPSGRTVRCASCGNSWRATPQDDAPLDLAPSAPAGEIPTPAASGAPVSKAFRAKVQAQKRTREAVAAGVVWAALSAAFVLVMLAAVLFRVEVVRLWPRTAGAYAAVKLPVNPTGLALDAVQGGPGLLDGRQVLVVSGTERNVEGASRPAVPVRVTLYDKSGHAAATRLVPVLDVAVAPGDARAFRTVFFDPPIASSEFKVEFAFDAAHPAPAPAPTVLRTRTHSAVTTTSTTVVHAGAAQAPALKGAAPVPATPAPAAPAARDARPLPAGSPYALPSHGGESLDG